MDKVFRLEDNNGHGPFVNCAYKGYDINMHEDEEHPGPVVDFVHVDRYSIKDFHFGFLTFCDVLKWFNKAELNYFTREGFEIKTFHTNFLIEGESKKQIIFIKQD